MVRKRLRLPKPELYNLSCNSAIYKENLKWMLNFQLNSLMIKYDDLLLECVVEV